MPLNKLFIVNLKTDSTDPPYFGGFRSLWTKTSFRVRFSQLFPGKDETVNKKKKLKSSDEHWLANYIEHAREAGVITNQDLLQVFSPEKLFTGYEQESDSRAKLLIGCINGFGQKTAEHLDIATCITLVDKALEMADVTADTIYSVVTPSEIVRTQNRRELWKLLGEKRWPDQETEQHRELMGAMLDAYVEHQLDGGQVRSLKTIEDTVGFASYVKYLPPEILTQILTKARGVADEDGPGGIPFTADVLADLVAPGLLAKHLPLPLLYGVLEGAAKKFEWVEVQSEESLDESSKEDASDSDTVMEVESSELSEHKEIVGIPEDALDSILPPMLGETLSSEGDEIGESTPESLPPGETLLIIDEDEDAGDKTTVMNEKDLEKAETSKDELVVAPPTPKRRGRKR